MSIHGLLLSIAALAATAPELHVAKLDGETVAGQFVELTPDALVISTGEQQVTIPQPNLVSARFEPVSAPNAAANNLTEISLTDGTRFSVSSVTTTGNEAAFESPVLGAFKAPVATVANIRLGATSPRLTEAWNALLARESTRDLLVVRREESLDSHAGIVGQVDAQSIKFLLEGEEIVVNRQKIFGVIFARPKSPGRNPLCKISLAGGDTLNAERLTGAKDQFQAELADGIKVTFPVTAATALDFSGGKIVYLSDMEPREAKYTPYFDEDEDFLRIRRDRTRDGTPLRLGSKTYSRGLWIHSKSQLRYRLAGEYRRFQAVMGIDRAVSNANGEVRVVISGDGQSLFEGDVKAADEPITLDLPIENVRDLEILVDFGGNLSIGDHLDLAEAKVIK